MIVLLMEVSSSDETLGGYEGYSIVVGTGEGLEKVWQVMKFFGDTEFYYGDISTLKKMVFG